MPNFDHSADKLADRITEAVAYSNETDNSLEYMLVPEEIRMIPAAVGYLKEAGFSVSASNDSIVVQW